jgi:hypothetical protein
MIKKTIDTNGIVADLFHDGSGEPRKAILLLGGSEGGKAWSSRGTKKLVSQLVNQGYALLSLAYFKSSGLPPYLEEIPLEYFTKAINWLVNQPEVRPNELAVIGMRLPLFWPAGIQKSRQSLLLVAVMWCGRVFQNWVPNRDPD